MTGGALSAGGSCNFNVTVTGTSEGNYENITGYISSNESGTSTNYATASLTVIAPPVLAKSFSPASIFTGNTSALTFVVTNPNMSSSLSGIGFSDPLPTGLTVANSGPTATCGGSLSTTAPSTISFSGGSLAANSSCTFSVTVTGATSGTKSNTTTAATSTEGGNGNTVSASLVVTNQTASIDLTKQVSATNADPWTKFIAVAEGGNTYYRFKVYNSGDLAFTALSVSDPTLSGTSVDPATCNWTAALPLAPGDTATCVKGPISATIGSHSNTATAQGTYASGSKTSTPSTATYATTGLTFAKSVAETHFTAAGNVLHYTFAVTNTGSAPLLGPVTVADDKATNESCPDVITVGDGDSYLDPGESITCTASYAVTAGDVTAKYVTNNAYATVSGVQSNTDSKTVNLAPDLTVTKSNNVSGIVNLGASFIWTLTISNSGSAGPASFANGQTLLTDDLPSAGYYSVGSVTNAGGTTGTINCAIAVGALNCTASGIVTIPPGGSFSVPITVTPTMSGSLDNPRSGGMCRVDPGNVIAEINEANNDASNSVIVAAAPDLRITKSDGGVSVSPGNIVTHTLGYTNTGNIGATNVTITETVPANTTFNAAASAPTGWSCPNGSPSGTVCTVNVGVVAGSGGTGTARFAVTVNSSLPAGTTQIANTATIGDDGTNGADANPGNNSSSDTTPIIGTAPDLRVIKSDGGVSAMPGGVVAYTLTYTNTGNVTATGVVITETVPANTTFTGSGWACTPNNNAGSTCTLNVGTVAGNGGTGAASFVVTIANALPAGTTQITNMVTISDDGANGPDGNPGDNNAIDSTPIIQCGRIQGVVFLDANGNGARDAGESAVSNVQIDLQQGGSTIQTVYSDGSGNYAFPLIAVGLYQLVETVPAGYTATTLTSWGVNVAACSTITIDFGLQQFTPTPTPTPIQRGLYLPLIVKGGPTPTPTRTPTLGPSNTPTRTPTPGSSSTPTITPPLSPTPIIVDPKGMLSDPARDHIFLVSNGDNTVDVYVESTLTPKGIPVRKILVGNKPFGIGMVNDKVYVANFGGSKPSSVSVINPTTLTVAKTIPLSSCGNEATHLAVNPNTGRVYIAMHASGTVAVIDSITDTLARCIGVGRGPFGITAHPASNSIFVGHRDSFDLWRIDGTTEVALKVVDWSGGQNAGAAFYVGVGLATNRLFAMVGLPNPDVPNRLFVYNIDSAGTLYNATVVSVGNTDDGGFVLESQCSGRIYIAETYDNQLRVLNGDLSFNWLITLSSGLIDQGPYGLLENVALARIYVSNKPAYTLSILGGCPFPGAPRAGTALPTRTGTPTRTLTRAVTPPIILDATRVRTPTPRAVPLPATTPLNTPTRTTTPKPPAAPTRGP